MIRILTVFQRSPLGQRLKLAFAAATFLTLLTGIIGMMMWESLGEKIDTILSDNIPVYTESYQVERNISLLQSTLNERMTTNELLPYSNLTTKIQMLLGVLEETYQFGVIQNAENIRLLAELKQAIVEQEVLLKQRITLQTQLVRQKEKLSWLHQDMIDEIEPVAQEIEWHVSLLAENATQHASLPELLREFSIIQDLSLKENELFSLVDEIVNQRYQRDLDNAFQYIGIKVENIEKDMLKLTDYPSTIAHRQILSDIIILVKPGGVFHQLLKKDTDNQQQLNTITPELTQLVSQFHVLVSENLNSTNRRLMDLRENTLESVVTGKIFIIVVLMLALVFSVLIQWQLVHRKLINRLNLLGEVMEKFAQGKMAMPTTLSGNDEIGMLSRRLSHFYNQMREMEKTNAINLINNTEASLITCFPDGTIESMNPSAVKLLESDSISSAQPLWKLLNQDNQDSLKVLFLPNSSLNKTGFSECILYDGKKRYLQFSLRRYEHLKDIRYIVTVNDITRQERSRKELSRLVAEKTQDLMLKNTQLTIEIEQRVQTEKELIQTQDELIQAAKMAVLGQTMTTIAHELNQPLSATNNYIFTAQMLLDRKDYKEIGSIISAIKDMSDRMQKIISSLRNFSRKSNSDIPLTAIAISDVIHSSLDIVDSRIKQEMVTVHLDVSADIDVLAEYTQLEQVLVNVLVNALDAVSKSDNKEVWLSCNTCSDILFLIIEDSGPGFESEILPHLFKPFTTTKEIGLGLGLNICRSILHRFNGEIYLASSVSKGAAIILEFKNESYRSQ
ncbi:HAMP domain-containing protein [Photobacterium sp. WH24]|uniref:ATP-binding protein n=1 Tax=Photobacterium sp. WH24 TaxID=2827237 RepID=UPI001C4777D8|nr:ATP-binding protein [Photobacterium sp. WH24]MBV7262797.1 HAMP domain-containing protein [Photobacterium sp. WH24]